MPYGVLASSTDVKISSINVNSNGNISTAGVSLSSWSALSYSSITAQAAHGLLITGSNNAVSFSTMVTNAADYIALYVYDSDSNTVTGSYIENLAGYGAILDNGADHNTISLSTMISNAADYIALYVYDSDSNTVTRSYIENPAGYGAILYNGADHNTISLSTMVSNAAGYAALYITNSASNTITRSYIQASSAVYVSGSTGTVINSSVLVAINTTGAAVWLLGASVNLSLSSNTITGGAQGSGIYLDVNNAGSIALSSNTIQGAGNGLFISTQATGAVLSIANMTFQSLPAGTTAINFGGGVFVSTFSNVNFADANIAVNVNAAPLSDGSTITMLNAAGRFGPAFENDPNNYVHWTLSQPGAPSGTALGVSSISWTWTAATNVLSYKVYQASSPATLIASTASVSFSHVGLATNTAYGIVVAGIDGSDQGPLSASATVYTLAVPPALSGFNVFTTSIAVQLDPGTNPPGTRLVISTGSGGNFNVASSSAGPSLGITTLTISGLAPNTLYAIQAAAVNGATPASTTTAISVAASTYTLAAAPSVSSFQVFTTSIAVTINPQGNPNGTGLSISTNGFTVASSSIRVVTGSLTTLTLSGLTPNTPYSLDIGAFDATVGASTQSLPGAEISTHTFGAVPTLAGFNVFTTSIAVTLGANGNPAGTPLMISTGTDRNFNVSLSSVGVVIGAETTLAIFDLSINTAYAIQAGVANNQVSPPTSSVVVTTSVYTLAAPVTGFSLTGVFVTSITVSWGANTNPAGTSYAVARWTIGGSTVTQTVTVTSAALTDLNFGATYYLAVRAVNGDGLMTVPDMTISTATNWPPSLSEQIGTDVGKTVIYTPPNGQVVIDVPIQAFPEPVSILVQVPARFPPAVSSVAELHPTGVGVEITLDKSFQPSRDVTITVGYRDQDVSGLNESKLVIARYDAVRSLWVPLVSSADPANNKVTAKTRHFSLFQIMETKPSGSVSSVKVFPNPFMPAKGHSSVTFANLPVNAVIKIYTLVGQLVRELAANASGMALWDARNDSGKEIASGVYFCLAEVEGQTKTFKVAVQR